MKRFALIITINALLVGLAPAQTQPDEDGPGRGVARLSVLNGEVSIRRGDSGDLVAAAVNAPLVVQDRVLTGPSSRAELQFDWANMIRIGAASEVRLSELEYRRYQIQIALGTATFRVLRDSEAQVELSTPSVAVRPLKKGVYRISVFEDGSSEITVRSGEVEIYTPRGSERLGAGRTMLARGTASDPEFRVVAAIGYDDWDRWNESRDRDLSRSRSYEYVASDIYGAEDLDNYGSWVDAGTYGRVWRPVVVADWAPYRYGRWSWIDYYGWTWVSYDPWGWAPYHYGRWFHDSRWGWCWWPGGRGRTYWRPALVSFFGWGNHRGFNIGVGFGYGNIGWVPLAPYETFHPWYGRGYYGGYRNRTTIVNNTTIINNTNITNIYRNARVTNAITAVNSDNFGRTHVGRDNLVRVNTGDVERAGLVRGQVPLTPARESLRMADRTPRTSALPNTSDDRRFFSTRQPTPVDRVPFEQQRQGIENVARRTFTDTSTPGPDRGGRGSGSPAVAGGGDDRGWRRAGEQPSNVNPTPSPDAAGRGSRNAEDSGRGWRGAGEQPSGVNATPPSGSWRRFGEPSHQNPANPTPNIDRGGRGAAEPQQDNNPNRGGWQRFGQPSGDSRGSGDPGRGARIESDRGGRSSSPAPAPTPQVERQDRGYRTFESNPGSRDSGNRDSGNRGWNSGGGRQSEPVRISPPIIRERTEPPPAAPRYEAPRYEAPRGGGGGGDRGGGGGGGDRGGGGGVRGGGGGGGERGGGGGGAPARSGGDGGGRSGGGERGGGRNR